ncbi:hypothetical protein M8J77_024267 [Diaphorina citri]|nr:hypothetical protein M8J77_024267 [Diaphorina citri]
MNLDLILQGGTYNKQIKIQPLKQIFFGPMKNALQIVECSICTILTFGVLKIPMPFKMSTISGDLVSPDKNPIDYCVGGFIKDLIYETSVESEEDLIGRIVPAFGFFVETRNIFRNIRKSMRRRCNLCIEHEGRQYQQFL